MTAEVQEPQQPHGKPFRTAIAQPQQPQRASILAATPAYEIEERAALASDRVPAVYLDAWARLQCQKPMAVSAAEWRQAIDAAGRFLDAWGAFAVEFQWTPGELLDVPRHGERCGLIWFLGGETVRALGPAHAITESGRNFLREVDFDTGLCRKGPLNDM